MGIALRMSTKGTILVNTRNLTTTAKTTAVIIHNKWAKLRCAILSRGEKLVHKTGKTKKKKNVKAGINMPRIHIW